MSNYWKRQQNEREIQLWIKLLFLIIFSIIYVFTIYDPNFELKNHYNISGCVSDESGKISLAHCGNPPLPFWPIQQGKIVSFSPTDNDSKSIDATGTASVFMKCKEFVIKNPDESYSEVEYLAGAMPNDEDVIQGSFQSLTLQYVTNVTQNKQMTLFVNGNWYSRYGALNYALDNCVWFK